jgi:hypothetical protein
MDPVLTFMFGWCSVGALVNAFLAYRGWYDQEPDFWLGVRLALSVVFWPFPLMMMAVGG